MVDERALPVEDRLEQLLVRFEHAVDRFERKISEEPLATTEHDPNSEDT